MLLPGSRPCNPVRCAAKLPSMVSSSASPDLWTSHAPNWISLQFQTVRHTCCHSFLLTLAPGTRALLTAVPSGNFDTTSSAMLYNYPDERELLAAPPHNISAFPPLCAVGVKLSAGSHAQCSDYYIKGLYRQHTNSSAFHDFSSQLGRARLINTNGFHVVCVSASSKDAGSVFNDGVMTLRFQKKGAKDGRC